MLVSIKHQHESAIGISMSLPSWISIPPPSPSHLSRLLQSPSLSSLSHMDWCILINMTCRNFISLVNRGIHNFVNIFYETKLWLFSTEIKVHLKSYFRLKLSKFLCMECNTSWHFKNLPYSKPSVFIAQCSMHTGCSPLSDASCLSGLILRGSWSCSSWGKETLNH